MSLNPSEVKDIDPGGTFNVDVTIADVSNLFAWQFLMHFDTNVLQVNNVTEGPFLNSLGLETDFLLATNNTVGYIIAGCLFKIPLPEYGASGDGVLATITFTVTGRGTITLEFDDDEKLTYLREVRWVDYEATPPVGYNIEISSSLVNGTFKNGAPEILSLPLIIAIVVAIAFCGVGAFYYMRRRGT